MSNAIIVKCRTYAYDEVNRAVRSALTLLGGIKRFVAPGQRVLIKPNLILGAEPRQAVTTHPSVVKAVISAVQEAGGIPLIGDSPPLGNMKRYAEKAGIAEVMNETGADFADFSHVIDIPPAHGTIFKRLAVAQTAADADVIINLPKLKSHGQMVLTAAVKNMFGCVPGLQKVQWHLIAGLDRDKFAQMILDLYQSIRPHLTIVDGIVGMHGNGPTAGSPIEIGVLLCGTDGVALDRVACHLLGIDPESVPIMRRARSHGIGSATLSEIEVLGAPLEDILVSGFTVPKTSDLWFGMPAFMRQHYVDALAMRPVISPTRCTLCKTCVTICPTGALTPHNDSIIFNSRLCIRCFCCQESCPSSAITIGEGWLLRIINSAKRWFSSVSNG